MDDAQPQQIALDLSRQHFSVQRGPLLMIGTWLQQEGGWEPCLCFVRGFDPPEDWRPELITLAKAYLFRAPSPNPQQAVMMAASIVHAVRMTEDRKSILKVLSIIEDHLDAFLTMPFLPPAERPKGDALGEVTVTDRATGKTLTEVVVDV